jgi:hypothetical protein
VDKDLARHVLMVALRSSGSLTGLLPLLKQHCRPDEYDLYKMAIARSAAEINIEILRKIFDEHPDLKAEIDGQIKKFGKHMG